MNILLVEDDYLQVEWLQSLISNAFPDAHIDWIGTESSFQSALPAINGSTPDLAIIDLMLPWDDGQSRLAGESKSPGQPFQAGLRCLETLRANPATVDLPAILYTVHDRSDLPGLPEGVLYIRKDAADSYLIRTIRSILTAHNKLPSRPRIDQGRKNIFISYSHKDQKFLEQLLVHLKPLMRGKDLAVWSDQQIEPGSKWFDDIQTALAASAVAIMLVSKDFLASDFIHEHELGPLLKKAEKGGVRILWVLVRACAFKETPLKHYQAVIPPDRPLAQMKAERDSAWVRICERIKDAVVV